MGPIGCPETSVRNYHFPLGNNPEERSFLLLRCGSPKSRIPTASVLRVFEEGRESKRASTLHVENQPMHRASTVRACVCVCVKRLPK